MIFRIYDDLSLPKIADSGQAFRVDGTGEYYRFLYKNNVIYIKEIIPTMYEISVQTHFVDQSVPVNKLKAPRKKNEDAPLFYASPKFFDEVVVPYFDLNRNYEELRKNAKGHSKFLDDALEFGKGIRILKQDPLETLISFIISQRKSIPAIKTSVELFAEKFGSKIKYPDLYFFPTLQQLADIEPVDLIDMKLGYRDDYIYNTVKALLKKPKLLDDMNKLSDVDLLMKLQEFDGVGLKVASCVALFAYGRTAIAPIDTWIGKVIDRFFEGKSPFSEFGDEAGIIQQYIFYYITHNKNLLD